MKYRHTGSFLDIRSQEWTVIITVDSPDALVQDTPIEHFAIDPVEIEYKAVDKWECLQGSTCTLRIESATLTQWQHLYAEKAGSVTLEVQCQGTTWWRGTLDPEFYEQPYERDRCFDVTLTFSDMGYLDRIRSDRQGIQPIGDILNYVLNKASGQNALNLVVPHISTSPTGLVGSASLLDNVAVDCDALDTTEDGKKEKPTLKSLLEAVMQPLGLRAVQRGGKFHVYDLHASYTATDAATAPVIEWDGDSSTLGVDKVYKTVTVKFDTHGTDEIINGEIDEDTLKADMGGMLWYARASWLHGNNDNVDGFNLYTSTQRRVGDLTLPSTSPAKFYRIAPIYSGSEERGIMVCACKFEDCTHPDSQRCRRIPGDTWGVYGAATNPTAQSSLPPVAEISARLHPRALHGTNRLRVTLDVRIDTRYNPFETADDDNYKKEYDYGKEHWNIAYVPVKIEYTAADGTVKHYTNGAIRRSTGYYGTSGWVNGAAGPLDCFLAYYDVKDRKKASGVLKWATNRQCIGITDKDLPLLFDKRADGEYIDMPTTPGTLKLTVLGGVSLCDAEEGAIAERKTGGGNKMVTDVYTTVRWLTYRDPKITVVDKYGNELDTEDIEYTSAIDPTAGDDLDINTDYGVVDRGIEGAKAAFYTFDSQRRPIGDLQSLTRGINTATPEQLLIGTIFSQYATRRPTLKGDVSLQASAWPFTFTDTRQGSRIFMIKSEVQRIREAVSEAAYVELAPEDFQHVTSSNG